MNITLKDIPNDLHQKLRERADQNGRSLNKEALRILEEAVNPIRRNPKELLQQIKKRRDRMPHLVKQGELRSLIEKGRQ